MKKEIYLHQKVLLGNEAAKNYPDAARYTAFMHACEIGSYKYAAILIDYGVDIDFKSFDGKTALDKARDPKIIELIKRTDR
ncbi:hypothetical protein SNE25_16005 [Mucilaginibacter sabulilitoris]|uniref:Ankyrin repeat domain-containing protein n=1 Tax=Mucilaginibacter sabulilitoris TaxID=1173583 RepID=A0ABZ0TW83_9SPHI|nr:ankyrin repeat domain-containing protein [Mucilaginibacter sabulilitoris]WPU97026.1 hypothetical protein SNE25_16005 [Mucilaginibacter sabulilitoris]